MDYIEVSVTLNPFRPFNEIVVAQLGELPFDSFTEEEENGVLKAYILEEDFTSVDLNELFSQFDGLVAIDFEVSKIEKVNWNQKWEENFQPVEVGDFCLIRAPFHEEQTNFKHEIVIEPKMSFGTGHHQTTFMMIQHMSKIDFVGKTVLDMGSGTGVLAILAKYLGAKEVEAIDIEDWAYKNMKENFERNKVKVGAYLGGEEVISKIGKKYDVIIANINKNILFSQFTTYNTHLNNGALLLLSGFYDTDADDIVAAKELIHYTLERKLEKDTWCALNLKKGS